MQGAKPSPSLKRLAAWTDDLSCAVLGFATATTILYHVVDAAMGRKGVVEGDAVSHAAFKSWSLINNMFGARQVVCLRASTAFQRLPFHPVHDVCIP